MSNGYGRLSDIKRDLAGVPATTVLDDALIRLRDEVSREFDRDRARLLDGLGISRAQGDFETLADNLNRIAAEASGRAKGARR